MQYDIAAKVIAELGKEDLLRHFLHLEPVAAELIEEIPQQTASLRSSDFPLRVQTREGDELIVLVEFQTRWAIDAVWRLIDYVVRFKQKYGLPVTAVMLLFRKHAGAEGVYRDESFEFRFHLVKLWEQPASELLSRGALALLPFTPVMSSTESEVLAAEQQLYESDLPRETKANLLTALGIFAGLREETLAQRLFERRRDLMIESPMYTLIKNEGVKEGIERGLEEGLERGIKEGRKEGLRAAVKLTLEERFGDAAYELTDAIEAINEIGRLEALQRALVRGDSLDAVRERLRG